MSRIGIDLDGVGYNFAASLRRYIEIFGHKVDGRKPIMPEPHRWEFYLDWGLSTPQFLDLCHRGVNAGIVFSYGTPWKGFIEALEALKEAGHTLHVITDRSFGSNGSSEQATRAWLDRYKAPFDSLTFTADKTIVKLDYMIDDKLQNYDALDAAGVQVYLMDRAWNSKTTDFKVRRRVKNMTEFVAAVTLEEFAKSELVGA